MPDQQRQPVATRIAQLELKDEQRLVKEGYELLDEKRIRLVAEIRAQLGRLRRWRAEVRKAQEVAQGALIAALNRHGIDELSAYPTLSDDEGELKFARIRLFGLEILEAQWHAAAARLTEQPVNPSPEARDCARDYRTLLEPLVMTAVCSLNLRRLMREYVRTERRARAIENVLLPEIAWSLKYIDEQLEILDQEEIARVRQRRYACAVATHAKVCVHTIVRLIGFPARGVIERVFQRAKPIQRPAGVRKREIYIRSGRCRPQAVYVSPRHRIHRPT